MKTKRLLAIATAAVLGGSALCSPVLAAESYHEVISEAVDTLTDQYAESIPRKRRSSPNLLRVPRQSFPSSSARPRIC